MKKIALPKLCRCLVKAFIIAFVAQTGWHLAFGRVVASSDIEIGSVRHRVVLRERCISGPIVAIIDRLVPARIADYEYWTELRQGWHLAAVSEREHWDSAAYDHPRIDDADVSGVTVFLDPRYLHVHRFDLHSAPN